jgi:ABC-type transport system involved in cytochrome c biogenesis ATPase subunit
VGLRVIKLIAENVKGIKVVEIVPDEHFQVIAGKNGQGKSSVMDAIWLALGGSDASKQTERPIRRGEESASVTLDLGDMVVSRKWKGDKTVLDVRTHDGAKYGSPQTMLDALIGRLSFDPLAFSTLKDAEQKQALLQLVDLPIDPDALDRKRKGLFDDRTHINRDAKAFEAQLAGMEKPVAGLPEKEVNASEVMAKIEAANVILAANNLKRTELTEAHSEYRDAKRDVEDADKAIVELESKLAAKKEERVKLSDIASALQEKGKTLKTQVDALVDPEFEAFKTEMAQVEETNRKIRNAATYKATEQSLKSKQAEAQELTVQMESIDKQKQDALAQAEYPIDGLAFDDTGVTYNCIPFRQCSSAERLKVSMAMAMAMNPKLRVIRIMDGSLLDRDNMELIHGMAVEQDYQVWVETVGEDASVGVVIEDGMVKVEEAVMSV